MLFRSPRQFELVMGYNPSFFSNQTCYASRPLENICGEDLYGGNYNIHKYPEKIKADSFFGKLRAKTGLPLIVPSSMQFEYAMRGGYYTGEYYRYKLRGEDGNLYTPENADIGRWKTNSAADPDGDSDTSAGTASVGSYLPNMFGLYDTMGNVYELTGEYVKSYNERLMSYDLELLRTEANDPTLGTTPENPVIDYTGRTADGSCYRTMGGSWNSASSVTIWNLGWHMQQVYKGATYSYVGVRVSMNVE